MNGKAVWIDEQLDQTKLQPIHFRALILCIIVMMIDSYDLYLVGWILPKLSDAFAVSRVALTPVLLLQQVGMVLGGYLLAPLADRIGRRNLLIVALAGLAVTSLLTSIARTPAEFTWGRIATGLFAAAILPNLLTLSAEIAPKRLRATFTAITLCGTMGGALIGAYMQAFLLPVYGWKSAVILGAALPAVILPVIALLLPESLRFIIRRNPEDQRIPRMAEAYGISRDDFANAQTARDRDRDVAEFAKPGIAALFGAGERNFTILLWLAFFCSFAFIGQWAAWGTTVFHDIIGLDWQDVAQVTTIYTLTGGIGTFTIGLAIDRWGFRQVLPTTFALGFIGAVGIGLLAPSGSMYLSLVMMSLFQVASQTGLAALAPTLYLPSSKATGVGAAFGAGRIGSMAGPALGSALLSSHVGIAGIFFGLGLPLLIAAFLLLVLLARSSDAGPRAAHRPM